MKLKPIPVAIALVATGMSSFSNAQLLDAEDTMVEEIAVTGTRIRSTDARPSQPVTILSGIELKDSGAVFLHEALNEMPQLGDALESGTSINRLNNGFAAGVQTVNLRNMGANRTLVLLNGRRRVASDVGAAGVDISAIPVDMVERVEILTGSATSIYGADAVTGAVNIILRNNLDLTAFSVRTGVSSEGDAGETAFSFTHGDNYSLGNYLFGLDYTKRDPVLGIDRDFAQFDGSAVTGEADVANGSGVNPGGLFASSNLGANGGFDQEGNFVSPFAERFQRVPFRSLINEAERLALTGRATAVINSTIEAFVEFDYADSSTTIQFEPQLAIFSDAGFTSTGSAGFRFPSANSVTVGDDVLTPITRRFSEFGPRESTIDRTLVSTTFGLEGSLGKTAVWEAYLQYGMVDSEQTDRDTIDKLRLLDAIDPVACADIAGCVFVDIYGRNSIDPASLDYVSDDLLSTTTSEQFIFAASLTGDLKELSTGAIKYAVGVEARSESVDIKPNAGLIAVPNTITSNGEGDLVGLKGSRTFFGNTTGSIDVSEAFFELNVPLHKQVSLGVSGRASSYSTTGQEGTFGSTLKYNILKSLGFRASFGTATRAPNVFELFSPEQVVTTGIADPCDTRDDEGNVLAISNGCTFGPDYNPTDLDQQIRGVTGGNRNLDSETAQTLTYGFVLNPSENLNVSLDYFSIDIDDVIAQGYSAQSTLNRCIDGDQVLCNNIQRDNSSGFVTSISSPFINISEESIAGIEMVFFKRFPIGSLELNWSGVVTQLLERKVKVNEDNPTEDILGRVDNPETKYRTSLTLGNDKYYVGINYRYIDEGLQSTSADPEVAIGNAIDSVQYLDLFASFQWGQHFSSRVGIENVTDESAPIITELYEKNGSGDAVAAGLYDVRGQFSYINLSYKF